MKDLVTAHENSSMMVAMTDALLDSPPFIFTPVCTFILVSQNSPKIIPGSF